MHHVRLLVLIFAALAAVSAHAFDVDAAARRLELAYRTAHETRKLEGVVALVHWQGVEPAMRESIRASIERDLALRVVDVKVVAPPTGEHYEITLNGRTFRTNLPVERNLVVTLAPGPASGTEPVRTIYPVGRLGERYAITVAAPVR